MEILCKKLGLNSEETIFDNRRGWGTLAQFASSKLGTHVTEIKLGRDQTKWGNSGSLADGIGEVQSEILCLDYPLLTRLLAWQWPSMLGSGILVRLWSKCMIFLIMMECLFFRPRGCRAGAVRRSNLGTNPYEKECVSCGWCIDSSGLIHRSYWERWVRGQVRRYDWYWLLGNFMEMVS